MKPVIGIIGIRTEIKRQITQEGNIVLYDYMKVLDKEDASYIGLITNDEYKFLDEEILNMCDGILMTGGVEIKSYHINIIKYAREKNIPFLGICQGVQALGLSTMTGEKLLNIDELSINHSPKLESSEDLSKMVHKVYLDEDSLLFKLLGREIEVNSNHHYVLPRVELPMKVVGKSEDGIIEAIEHTDSNHFAIGVQWHPEYLESMQPLIHEFVNRARQRKENR